MESSVIIYIVVFALLEARLRKKGRANLISAGGQAICGRMKSMEQVFLSLSNERIEKPYMMSNPEKPKTENPEPTSSVNNPGEESRQKSEASSGSISEFDRVEDETQEKAREKKQLEKRLEKLLVAPSNRISRMIWEASVAIAKSEILEDSNQKGEKDETRSEEERARILETIKRILETISRLLARRLLEPLLMVLLTNERRKRLQEFKKDYGKYLEVENQEVRGDLFVKNETESDTMVD